MKIVHVSHALRSGGAAIAAFRLNEAMIKAGLNSSLVTKDNLSAQPMGRSLKRELLDLVQERLYERRHVSAGVSYSIKGTWSDGFGRNICESNQRIMDADVVYLHWINWETLSIEEIGRLLDTGKQIVWFMHDMWPLTGGCHHSFECTKYQDHCAKCPMLGSSDEKDPSYTIFERKLQGWSGHRNFSVITPSRWLADCAGKSRLFSASRITVIPNIIDPEVFRPIDKQAARTVLGLPPDKRLLLFGCDGGTGNFYKGWPYLETALGKMDLSNCELVVFGEEKNRDILDKFNTKVHFLGRLQDEKTSLAAAYSAADVFISPSLAENFSQTLCESSACGTPAVCFDIGGNSDIVLHRRTGYLARYKDSDDLAAGIAWVMQTNADRSLSKAAREHIAALCSPEKVVRQHQEFLQSLTD